ncbi:MAG: hypothetical protein ABSH34_13285 [Verrucomicrobiota bacterium]|jgi:hypothetical protein
MKRLSTVLLSLCLLGAATAARAQQPHLYAVIDYMHIPDDKSDQDYIALEKLWQRLHQKAVDAGICRGWHMDRVENGGRNDFVTIRVYDSLNKIVDPWPDSLTKGLFTSQEEAQMNQTAEVRQLTRSELWEVEASAVKSLEGQSQHYSSINFMKPKPGKAGDYYKMEKEIWSKLHKARVDAGLMDGWYFLSRMFPSGHDAEYDFITVDIYADKAASEKSFDSELAQKALSKEDFAKVNTTLDLRTVVRREIWHSLLQAVPSKK